MSLSYYKAPPALIWSCLAFPCLLTMLRPTWGVSSSRQGYMTQVRLRICTLFRRAFRDTMKDPEFLAETSKANMDVDPVGGEDLERLVNGFFKLDSTIVGKLREILK